MVDEAEGPRRRETTKERIDRLVAEGKIPPEAVERAERLWSERLIHGVLMPNGETAIVQLSDLYHLIVDRRIWREPERFERMLAAVFEIRTARQGETDRLHPVEGRWRRASGLDYP
jgi:hypothetical protein